MADENYRYDPDTLSFKKNSTKKGRKFLFSVLTQLLAATAIGIVVFLAISYTIETPRQKKIERENQVMQKEYEVLVGRYNQANAVLQDLKTRDTDLYRAIFETEPAKEEIIKKTDYSNDSITTETILNQHKYKSDSIAKLLKEEESITTELWYVLQNYKKDLQNFPSIQPLDNQNLQFLPYGFGRKLDPIYKTPVVHKGIDFSATKGTEVRSTANGTVEEIGDKRDFGKYITINHKNGYVTVYAHLSGQVVKKGQKVKRGETIGFVGNTGKSLTPHLHYEIKYNGNNVNPVNYFFEDTNPMQQSAIKKLANNGGLCLD